MVFFKSKKDKPPVLQVWVDKDVSFDSGTEVSIPPPPPPGTPPASSRMTERDGLYRSSVTPAESQPSRKTYLIEEDASVESIDVTMWPSRWNKWFDPKKENYQQKRRLCGLITFMLAFLMVLVVAIGVVKKQENGASSGEIAYLYGDTQPSPTPEPYTVPQPTAPPPVTSPPTTAPPTTAKPTCESFVVANQSCYKPFTVITVGFVNCEYSYDDWIGIFNVTNGGVNPYDLPEPDRWLWTCNSQYLDDCVGTQTPKATLPFYPGLPNGLYEIHLVQRHPGGGHPYVSYRVAPIIEVGNCKNV